MHVTIVTAGGAGMFCGSCLLDNAWARGLRDHGLDVTLVPLYTPIRVDDEDLSTSRVFYGGINVYLDQHLPGWRYLPRWMTRVLDRRGLLELASKRGISNDAAELGRMTVELLRGSAGPQQREGAELVRYLARELKPDIIIFSNLMLAADVAELKQVFPGPVLSMVQGDDIFLDQLHEPWRSQAFDLLRPIVNQLDGFLLHSQFYSDYMQGYLGLPAERQRLLPLAIDTRGHSGRPRSRSAGPATIGYFARLAPEKGLKEFVLAGLELNRQRQDFQLVAGGYAPPQFSDYFREVQQLAAPLGDRFRYVGSPDTLQDKVDLLSTFDLLSVPAPYKEPKGLYVLEAMANGVPVIQPAHGSFPELIASTGGGLDVEPGNHAALAQAWNELLNSEEQRLQLARNGWEQTRQRHDLPVLAAHSESLFRELLASRSSKP